ncbi:MAG: hypothetical protein FJY85_03910 [Deltaproteobacteria bacterium]|nr:hypothetical protein [Deltaproteobacteria bacterium]
MRRTLIPLTVMILLSLVGGCAVHDNPVESSTYQPPSKAPKIAEDQELKFIQLPKDNALRKIVSATGLITAKKGGSITLQHRVGFARIWMTLTFPRGAVQEDTYVTMSLDDEVLATTVEVSFGPTGTSFLKPGSLDVLAIGLDLSSLSSSGFHSDDVALLWYNPTTGLWEKMEADHIMVSTRVGMLVCNNGKIPHFSRYAFGIIRTD